MKWVCLLVFAAATAWAEDVVVAARDVPAGTVLAEKDLSVREVPATWAAGAVLRRDLKRLVGQRLLVPLVEGDVIRASLAGAGETAGGLCAARVKAGSVDAQLSTIRRAFIKRPKRPRVTNE